MPVRPKDFGIFCYLLKTTDELNVKYVILTAGIFANALGNLY